MIGGSAAESKTEATSFWKEKYNWKELRQCRKIPVESHRTFFFLNNAAATKTSNSGEKLGVDRSVLLSNRKNEGEERV